MKLTKIINEVTRSNKNYLKYFKEFINLYYIDPLLNFYSEEKLSPKAEKFLNVIKIWDNNITLNDVNVEATDLGNWTVYYKGSRLGVVNKNLLDEETIENYGLQKGNKNSVNNEYICHSIETVKEGVLKCTTSEDCWDYFIKHILAIKGIDDKIRYKYADLRKGENICQIYFDFINGTNSFKLLHPSKNYILK